MACGAFNVLFSGLLSFALGLVTPLATFRIVKRPVGILLQIEAFVAAFGIIQLCNAYWWRLSILELHNTSAWSALLLFWGVLVYFYLIHYETVVRGGGPTFMLFRFIDESKDGTRERQEILDFFSDQTVLSERIEALIAAGWLKQSASGSLTVDWRSRMALFMINGWSRLLRYPWGG